MKPKNCNRLFYLIFIGVVSLGLYACSSSTDPYKPYIGNGEQVYPSKSDSITAYSGRYRVGLKISKPVDPHVKEAGIFWRNGTDSLKVDFPQSKDTLSVEIDTLESEGSYTFNIYTYDKKGNKSVGQTVITQVYGSNYSSSLLNRKLTSALNSDRGTIISLGKTHLGMIGSEIKYTNKLNKPDSVFVPADSNRATLINFKTNSKLKYRALYRPDSTAIDTFKTAFDTAQFSLVKKSYKFDNGTKEGWTLDNSNFTLKTDQSYSGEYSIGGTADKLGELWAHIEPSEINGGGRIDSLTFKYFETSNNSGGGMRVLDSSGNMITAATTGNPNYNTYGANGFKEYGKPTSSDYNVWVKVKIAFNWKDGMAEITFTDTESGESEIHSVTLAKNTNVSRLEIANYGSPNSGFKTGGGDFRVDDVEFSGHVLN